MSANNAELPRSLSLHGRINKAKMLCARVNFLSKVGRSDPSKSVSDVGSRKGEFALRLKMTRWAKGRRKVVSLTHLTLHLNLTLSKTPALCVAICVLLRDHVFRDRSLSAGPFSSHPFFSLWQWRWKSFCVSFSDSQPFNLPHLFFRKINRIISNTVRSWC